MNAKALDESALANAEVEFFRRIKNFHHRVHRGHGDFRRNKPSYSVSSVSSVVNLFQSVKIST